MVKVNPARTADLSNTASVSVLPTDPSPGNNSATEGDRGQYGGELVDHEVGLAGPGVGGQQPDLHDDGGLGGSRRTRWVCRCPMVAGGTSFVSAAGTGGGMSGRVAW